MAKKSLEDRFMASMDSAAEAGDTLAKQRLSGNYSLTGRDSRRTLRDIKPRPSGATRNLDPYHVLDLADSIATLGLLQPIAIDKHNNLVAGEHRLEACRLLDIENSEGRRSHWTQLISSTDKVIKISDENDVQERITNLNHEEYIKRYPDRQISVQVLQFDSEKEPESALAAETAENEKRQNYNKEEILNLAKKLKKAGFIEPPKGRPKKGEKSLKRALTVISGKSFRQIQRDLEIKKSTTHDVLFDEAKELKKVSKILQNFVDNVPEHGLSKNFTSLIKKIDKEIQS